MELKYLTEQRSENQEKMQKILDTAKLEKRALSEEEIAKFNDQRNIIQKNVFALFLFTFSRAFRSGPPEAVSVVWIFFSFASCKKCFYVV